MYLPESQLTSLCLDLELTRVRPAPPYSPAMLSRISTSPSICVCSWECRFGIFACIFALRHQVLEIGGKQVHLCVCAMCGISVSSACCRNTGALECYHNVFSAAPSDSVGVCGVGLQGCGLGCLV